jgi:hypothetical protein
MKKTLAATAMIALSFALVGCASFTESFTESSDVELKATAENNIEVSVQWEVQTAVESKAGTFEGPAPKTIEVGSFERIKRIYARAHRVYDVPNKLTLELVVDGKTVDKASTEDPFGQVSVEYAGD